VTLGTLLTKLNNSIVNSEGFKFFFEKTFLERNRDALQILNFGGDRETINVNICQG